MAPSAKLPRKTTPMPRTYDDISMPNRNDPKSFLLFHHVIHNIIGQQWVKFYLTIFPRKWCIPIKSPANPGKSFIIIKCPRSTWTVQGSHISPSHILPKAIHWKATARAPSNHRLVGFQPRPGCSPAQLRPKPWVFGKSDANFQGVLRRKNMGTSYTMVQFGIGYYTIHSFAFHICTDHHACNEAR